MPNIEVKLRRGTTAQHSTFTGAEGEVTVDTDKDTLVVHDGTTAGGHELRRKDDTIATAEIDDNAVTPAKLDDTQAYTVSGLISDGANILINNTIDISNLIKAFTFNFFYILISISLFSAVKI